MPVDALPLGGKRGDGADDHATDHAEEDDGDPPAVVNSSDRVRLWRCGGASGLTSSMAAGVCSSHQHHPGPYQRHPA